MTSNAISDCLLCLHYQVPSCHMSSDRRETVHLAESLHHLPPSSVCTPPQALTPILQLASLTGSPATVLPSLIPPQQTSLFLPLSLSLSLPVSVIKCPFGQKVLMDRHPLPVCMCVYTQTCLPGPCQFSLSDSNGIIQ